MTPVWLVPILTILVLAIQSASPVVFESVYSPREIALVAEPTTDDWKNAPVVVLDRDYFGNPVGAPPTEVRSRWTDAHLYLLYASRYEVLNLKPEPDTVNETPRLWTWDVAEAFIGADFERIGRYREFQVSPQGEWVDLDINRDDPRSHLGARWNSGYAVQARIDAAARTWYGLMKIPFAAIDARTPERGRELRLGLFRIGGLDPAKQHYAWRPTGEANFHVPKAFGILRLR